MHFNLNRKLKIPIGPLITIYCYGVSVVGLERIEIADYPRTILLSSLYMQGLPF